MHTAQTQAGKQLCILGQGRCFYIQHIASCHIPDTAAVGSEVLERSETRAAFLFNEILSHGFRGGKLYTGS
jgi:hypothetical protein